MTTQTSAALSAPSILLGALTVSLDSKKAPIAVASMREARERVLKSIGSMRSSAWYRRGAGAIFSDGEPVAFVSYNGRVWSGVNDHKAGHAEIVIS